MVARFFTKLLIELFLCGLRLVTVWNRFIYLVRRQAWRKFLLSSLSSLWFARSEHTYQFIEKKCFFYSDPVSLVCLCLSCEPPAVQKYKNNSVMRPDGTVGGILFFLPSAVKVFTICHIDGGMLTVTHALVYYVSLQWFFFFCLLVFFPATWQGIALSICLTVEKTEIFLIAVAFLDLN